MICKLLNKASDKRLCTKLGVEEFFSHPWLKDIDPKLLYEKKIKAPFIPQLEGELDTKYFSAK